MKELKVIVRKSKNNNYMYATLVGDLGYKEVSLSFDRYLCADLVGVTVEELLSTEGTYKINIEG